MTNNPTDLQAALRKACEDANENIIAALNGTTSIKHMGPAVFECIARCYERRLTPVFEALRDSVIEECARVAGQCWNNWNSEQFCHAAHIERQIRALKGAPR